MNKEKLKHLPFNLFYCLNSFTIPFLILDILLNVNWLVSLIFSLAIYLRDISQETSKDYLKEENDKHRNKFSSN